MPRQSECPHCGLKPDDEPLAAPEWPKEMNLTKVTGPHGQMAWREAIIHNRLRNAVSPEDAKMIGGLIDGAARAKVPTAGAGDKNNTENKLAEIERQLWEASKAGGTAE